MNIKLNSRIFIKHEHWCIKRLDVISPIYRCPITKRKWFAAFNHLSSRCVRLNVFTNDSKLYAWSSKWIVCWVTLMENRNLIAAESVNRRRLKRTYQWQKNNHRVFCNPLNIPFLTNINNNYKNVLFAPNYKFLKCYIVKTGLCITRFAKYIIDTAVDISGKTIRWSYRFNKKY